MRLGQRRLICWIFIQALKSLEGEISEVVPEYQEVMEGMRQVLNVRDRINATWIKNLPCSQSNDVFSPIPLEVMNLHKHLIALLGEYDGLTRRVKGYPCLSGSARERVQLAIARQASLFMAKEAGVLQVSWWQQSQERSPSEDDVSSYFPTYKNSDTNEQLLPSHPGDRLQQS
jgi:hypothetical protein